YPGRGLRKRILWPVCFRDSREDPYISRCRHRLDGFSLRQRRTERNTGRRYTRTGRSSAERLYIYDIREIRRQDRGIEEETVPSGIQTLKKSESCGTVSFLHVKG